MEEINDRVQLSKKWRVFQEYSLNGAYGCVYALIILYNSIAEKIFMKAGLMTFYYYFVVGVIVLGVILIIFSGGTGAFRLLNIKRLIKLLEKEENGGV